MSKSAMILGITGQVGSYLCEDLLDKGYNVFGIKRRSSSFNTDRINHIFNHPNLKLEYGDITDYASISNLVSKIKPTYLFNCAAQSHVKVSFEIPIYTADATGTGVLNCLEAIRTHSPETRFITTSSSEMFGGIPGTEPQNEETALFPKSPYGCAKAYGHYITKNYREAYNLFAATIIAFNNESPRRGENFVTRKITRAATRIKLGLQDKLLLGNMSALRDWSHSKDVCDAMYKIITAPTPSDYVVASGETHSVREFADLVFSKLGLNYQDYVEFDPTYLRNSEVDVLLGDASKIKKELGWQPKYTFEQLVDEMIESDMELAKKEKILKDYK
jgi:GDPmannose 4,6-dehydratase